MKVFQDMGPVFSSFRAKAEAAFGDYYSLWTVY